jgi:hypothetical protein
MQVTLALKRAFAGHERRYGKSCLSLYWRIDPKEKSLFVKDFENGSWSEWRYSGKKLVCLREGGETL